MNTLHAGKKNVMLLSILLGTAKERINSFALVLQLQNRFLYIYKLGEKPLNILSGMHCMRIETYVLKALIHTH